MSNGNTNNDWKSYKISVSSEQLDQVMSEDNWPAGVRARTFLPKRTNQSFRQHRERPNGNGDNNRPTRQAHGTHERRRPNIRVWHNDDITGEPYSAQRGNNIRRRSYRYDQPSQDGEWANERRRPNKRACHDESTRDTYSAQRGNNIRRRSYRYDQPPRTGNGPTNPDDRTNARVMARARETRTAHNVATTSADDRTDTTNPPRTGNGPTNKDDRTNARVMTTRLDEIPTTTTHGTNTPDNTHITMTHVGYNAKGFKQSVMYVSELLSHADTVGITETWLRPGELSVIKPTLLGSPALNNVNADD